MKEMILSLAAIILSSPALAGMEEICMDHAEMEAALIDWYQARQQPVSPVAGLDYWVSDSTGVWALIDPQANGIACVIAKGDAGAVTVPVMIGQAAPATSENG